MMLLSKIQYFLGICFILFLGCTKTEPSAFQKESFIKSFGGAFQDDAIDIISDNGNYYVLGNTRDENDNTQIFLTKTDDFGNRVWLTDITYSIDNKQTKAGQIIKLEKQPGFAIVGAIEMDDSSSYFDTYLLIIDADGNVVTETVFNNTLYNDYGKCIAELNNGGFTISSMSSPVSGTGSVINSMTASSTGEFIEKYNPIEASELYQICKRNDNNGYYVAAYSTLPFIMLINADGSPGGSVKLDQIEGQIKSIAQDNDGNTFVCGKINAGSNLSNDGFIAKFTSVEYATVEWLKEYNNAGIDYAGIDYFEQMVFTENNEILIAGSTQNKVLDTYDIWVMKTDIAGNKLSETIIGGENNEYGIRILEAENNKYIVEGTTWLEKSSMISIFKSELK